MVQHKSIQPILHTFSSSRIDVLLRAVLHSEILPKTADHQQLCKPRRRKPVSSDGVRKPGQVKWQEGLLFAKGQIWAFGIFYGGGRLGLRAGGLEGGVRGAGSSDRCLIRHNFSTFEAWKYIPDKPTLFTSVLLHQQKQSTKSSCVVTTETQVCYWYLWVQFKIISWVACHIPPRGNTAPPIHLPKWV